jgi:hypothetical protein
VNLGGSGAGALVGHPGELPAERGCVATAGHGCDAGQGDALLGGSNHLAPGCFRLRNVNACKHAVTSCYPESGV